MQQRRLGANGPEVGALGLGCMSFAGFYGPTDKAESFATLKRALDLGVTHLDTAILYGMGLSETVIGEFIRDNPNEFVIASKCGIVPKPQRHFNNRPEYVREAVEGSLKRLGVDHIPLYYLHRREHEIPIEEAIETMAALVREGKIGGIGLSEVAPSTLERACAVHPVMAVQNEYSLWTRLPELGLIQACKRLGVAFVAFSPVGRGIFADTAPDPAAFGENDFRRTNPRFVAPNWSANNARVEALRSYARDHGWSTAALAIAWTLAQGDHVIPIPGTRSPAHLDQLAQGLEIRLGAKELAEIENILPVGFAHGERYTPAQLIGTELYC
ncbi:MAG: aldo/keto reductase [Phyllobacteriaceae bacterium]|nr:aldo/keto reductase [Phyllobacteriaceae bacterium]MBA90734.1 aldo/keto reductase [Phyllobacteriaceae bacterium]